MVIFYSIADDCQYWLNLTSGTLKSPYFHNDGHYGNNLNCIWTLKSEKGFYMYLEIDYFEVDNDFKHIYSLKFSNK